MASPVPISIAWLPLLQTLFPGNRCVLGAGHDSSPWYLRQLLDQSCTLSALSPARRGVDGSRASHGPVQSKWADDCVTDSSLMPAPASVGYPKFTEASWRRSMCPRYPDARA